MLVKSLLAILLLLSQGALGAQSNPRSEVEDSVLIEKRTEVLKRGESAPAHRKEALINYPVVTGLKDSAVLQRVQTAVSLKKIFGSSLDELRAEVKEDWWLSEIRYQVNYNKHFILDLTFIRSGMGAYPSEMAEHRVINLKTGNLLSASDVFDPSSLNTLVGMVNQAMQAEVQRKMKEMDKEYRGIVTGDLEGVKFRRKNLDHFSVSDKGVTFLYDFGFPHAIKALEPSGRYFFSYEKLKAYIKREGLLGPFVQ